MGVGTSARGVEETEARDGRRRKKRSRWKESIGGGEKMYAPRLCRFVGGFRDETGGNGSARDRLGAQILGFESMIGKAGSR